MNIRFFNTLTGKIEKLPSKKGKRLNMFVCGPTVYDFAHIGHARTYIAFDMIVKYLRAKGYKPFYLQNITDIDDKIIDRAKREKEDPLMLAKRFEKTYFQDMKALKVSSVDTYARATDFIPHIIKQIWTLMKKGFAYGTRGGVYFEIAKCKEYGKLSHQNLDQLRKAVRIEPDKNKKYDFDFALWKASKPGEPSWDSPWGKGRPGWHIEDTAISEHHFSSQYELHGGARDLIFPHHESEIAQMESASGKKPFVKMWLHTGFLNVGGEKMSKSLGNFITIRDFLKSYPPEVLRFIVLSAHYRSPIDYTPKVAEQAQESLQRISDFIERLKTLKHKNTRLRQGFGGRAKTRKQKNNSEFKNFEKEFENALENDFNTPKALALLFEFITRVNKQIAAAQLAATDAKKIVDFFKKWDAIWKIIPPKTAVPKEILELANERERLRKEERWEEADMIRFKLKGLGWAVEDTLQGPKVKKQN